MLWCPLCSRFAKPMIVPDTSWCAWYTSGIWAALLRLLFAELPATRQLASAAGVGASSAVETREATGVDDVEGEQGLARGEGADVEGMSRVQDLVAANEVFVDKVHRECTAEAMDKLDSKREALVRIIADEVLPLLAAFNAAAVDAVASGARKKAARRAVLSYDSVNNAVWIRGATLDALQAFSDSARKGEDDAEECDVKLLHPRDRNGRLVGDCVSTRAAEAALSEYREACDEAAAAVRAVLRSVLHVHMSQAPLRLLVGDRWVSCFDGMSCLMPVSGSFRPGFRSAWLTSSTPSRSASSPRR